MTTGPTSKIPQSHGSADYLTKFARYFEPIPLKLDIPDVPSLAFLLVAVLTLLIAATFNQYGFVSDDNAGFLRAIQTYKFLVSGGTYTVDVSRFDIINMYGAMPDIIALVVQKLVPAMSYDSRHLVAALFGLAGIFYVYRLGKEFVGTRAGLLAALFLACNPMWFGYMFIDIKDIPFAATLLAATFYCLMALTGRVQSSAVWLKLGASVGLLATTKILGPLMLGFAVLLSLVFMVRTAGPMRLTINKTFFSRIALGVIAAAVGCLLCFVLFWPEFFFFGISNLIVVVKTFMNYKSWNYTNLLGGTTYPAAETPWYYTSTYLVIAMPLVLLILTAAGSILGFLRRQPMIMASAAFCICCIAEEILTGARAYNGYRHYLFLLPFCALVAAYPASLLTEIGRHGVFRLAAGAAIVLGLSLALVDMYRLHPYEYSYYNMLVGGLPGADGRYEIDTWRSAQREALGRLEKLPENRHRVIRLFSCGTDIDSSNHPRVDWVVRLDSADYLIQFRNGCATNSFTSGPMAIEVRRLGVLFARVYAAR